TFAWPPRTRSGSSASRSPSTSVARPLPRAAMRSRPPALLALLAARLGARFRRRSLDDVDELRRRLGGERLLGLRECDRSRVEATPATPAVPDRPIDLAARELLPLRELRLALLPDRQQRRGDEDRRVRTRGDADDQREREVLQGRAAEDLERDDRQQRDERRGQRASNRLPERDVHDRRERL